MAIGSGEIAYFNLHDDAGGGSSETGVNSSDDDTTSGELTGLDDLDDTSSSATGVSVECAQTRSGNGSGREEPLGGDQFQIDINDQGMFRETTTSDYQWTIKFPTSHPDVKVHLFLCTTFSNQGDLSCTVEGSTPTGFASIDSTGNTNGDIFSTTGFEVIGVDDDLDIVFDNEDAGTRFVFLNGMGFEVEAGAAGDSANDEYYKFLLAGGQL